ncbi:MAG: hypothetical protein ACR2HE_09130, partial [Casimicrobiaceae bacterium]
ADIVLPKTTTLEEEEINLNQQAPCVTYMGATSRRDGDVKSDLDIAVGLIDRLAARGAADAKFFPFARAPNSMTISCATARSTSRR